jgi:hypothetical protein
MKRAVSRKRTYFFLGLVILILLVALGIFYTRSIYVSSCAVLSAQAVSEAIPFEGNITDIIPCPAPEPEAIPVNPPTNGPPASGSSGDSSSSSKSRPNILGNESNSTNGSEVGLSPPFEQNTSDEYYVSSSQSLVDEYIANNNLNVGCSVYNRTLPGAATLFILDGYSNVSFLGIDVRVPIKSRLVIADNQIILECIKRPWWAYLFR